MLVFPCVIAGLNGQVRRRPIEGALQRLPLGSLHGLFSVLAPADGIPVAPFGRKKCVRGHVLVMLGVILGEHAHAFKVDGYGMLVLHLARDGDDISIAQVHLAKNGRGAGELEFR